MLCDAPPRNPRPLATARHHLCCGGAQEVLLAVKKLAQFANRQKEESRTLTELGFPNVREVCAACAMTPGLGIVPRHKPPHRPHASLTPRGQRAGCGQGCGCGAGRGGGGHL